MQGQKSAFIRRTRILGHTGRARARLLVTGYCRICRSGRAHACLRREANAVYCRESLGTNCSGEERFATHPLAYPARVLRPLADAD